MKASIIICTLLLLITGNIALADDVGYEVEVIIFEDTTGAYKHSEKWPEPETTEEIKDDADKMDEETTENIESEIEEAKPIIFENIEKESYRLNKQAEKLEKSPDYRILVHKAWKQPGLDKESALPMKITNNTDPENSDNIIKSYIDGDITLIMSRYLHINTNLIFHKLIPRPFNTYTNTDENSINNFRDYPLVFERRMRSKEIHYIDHPLVGIIVLAIPFKIKAEEAPQQEIYKTLQ